jgi:hypothetical protein
VDFDVNVYALVNRAVYSSNIEILGGNYVADLCIPLINTDISLKNAGSASFSDNGFGLGDILVEPFLLAWHGPPLRCGSWRGRVPALAQLGDAQLQGADAGIKAAVTGAVAVTDPLGASFVAAGPDQTVHIGFYEKLQDGFRQGAKKIAAVGLLHQLNECHAVLGHRGLLWLQVRLRNFTLQPIGPMATSPIPSRLAVSPASLDDSRIYTTSGDATRWSVWGVRQSEKWRGA